MLDNMLDYENRIYLSKRNLLTLLSKLERFEQGQETFCSIIKHSTPLDPYCNTMDEVIVIAIPDEKFYTRRTFGEVHPDDDPKTEIEYNEP